MRIEFRGKRERGGCDREGIPRKIKLSLPNATRGRERKIRRKIEIGGEIDVEFFAARFVR